MSDASAPPEPGATPAGVTEADRREAGDPGGTTVRGDEGPGAGAATTGGTIVRSRRARLRPILWRLHFLGGFLAAPVALWLAVTGVLFAWNPQIESLLFGDEQAATAEGPARPLSEQVGAVIEAYPDHTVAEVAPAPGDGDTTGVVIEPPGAVAEGFAPAPGAFTVYVDPASATITGRVDETDRPDEWLRNLHSNFRLGTGVGTLTELAASWVLVALLTGLYLWWPRTGRALRRGLVPRAKGLRAGGRRPWRDLHSTLGVLSFALLAVIVVTGLTWTEYAGRWVDVTKDALAVEAPMLQTDLAAAEVGSDAGGSGGGHAGHQGGDGSASGVDLDALDQVAGGATDAGLASPLTISPAGEAGQAWTVAEVDDRWPIRRTTAAVDPASGEVVDRLQFSDQPLLDQATSIGIGFHEGSLFGLVNQLLLTVLALALIVLLVAGYAMWWRRRPSGAFGTPPKVGSLLRSVPIPLLVGFVLLMVLLPTLGVAFVVYLVAERLVRPLWRRRRPAPPTPTPAPVA